MTQENANKTLVNYKINELLLFLSSRIAECYIENYNYKSKDWEGKDQPQDERNVIP
jgi:hypothetical protein